MLSNFPSLEKLNIDNIILKIILLFPISTIIQGISFLDPINKLLIALLVGFLGLKILIQTVNNFNIKSFALLIAFAVSSLTGIILSDNFYFNINNLFHYLIFGLYAVYLINDSKEFKLNIEKEQRFLLIITLIWTFIVAVSFFFESSFIKAWGTDVYFKSFSEGTPHRFASSCCFILILVLAMLRKHNEFDKKKIGLYTLLILPTICVFLSGARVYLIIAVLTLVIIYYNECKTAKIFWLTTIPAMFLLFIAVMISPMGNKMITTFTDPYATNVLAGFTSGRSEFWVYDLDAFLNSDPYFQIFGSGVSFVFDVNRTLIGNPIYAHND